MQKRLGNNIRRRPSYLTFKKGVQGLGVFSTADIAKGKVLFKMHGQILEIPTRTSVQIGKHKHIEDFIGAHVNHSCHPNAKVAKRKHAFVSTKNIHKGEEITFNYNKNEDHLASPFVCASCGKKICGKNGITKKYSHLQKYK